MVKKQYPEESLLPSKNDDDCQIDTATPTLYNAATMTGHNLLLLYLLLFIVVTMIVIVIMGIPTMGMRFGCHGKLATYKWYCEDV